MIFPFSRSRWRFLRFPRAGLFDKFKGREGKRRGEDGGRNGFIATKSGNYCRGTNFWHRALATARFSRIPLNSFVRFTIRFTPSSWPRHGRLKEGTGEVADAMIDGWIHLSHGSPCVLSPRDLLLHLLHRPMLVPIRDIFSLRLFVSC